MRDIAYQLVWLLILAIAISQAFVWYVRSIENSSSYNSAPTVIRDVLDRNAHHLSGVLLVAKTCSTLFVRTEKISTDTYALVFETRDEPSVSCAEEASPREFHTIAFAQSSSVHFIATLDGTPVAISVYDETSTP